MTEDLLTTIRQETHERLHELRGAVQEHDRLQAELRALDAAREPCAEAESPVEPPTNVVRLSSRPRVPRTRVVSPKVARLMQAPRRPALERAGVVRVGAGRDGDLLGARPGLGSVVPARDIGGGSCAA
jgi:hypothetical protein